MATNDLPVAGYSATIPVSDGAYLKAWIELPLEEGVEPEETMEHCVSIVHATIQSVLKGSGREARASVRETLYGVEVEVNDGA